MIKNKTNELNELNGIIKDFVTYIYKSPNDFSKILVKTVENAIREHEGYGVYKTFFNTIGDNNSKIRNALLDHNKKMASYPPLKPLINPNNINIDNLPNETPRNDLFNECISTTVFIGSIGNFNVSGMLYDTSSFNTKFYTELLTNTVVPSIYKSVISQKASKIHNILLSYLPSDGIIEIDEEISPSNKKPSVPLNGMDEHKVRMEKILKGLITKLDNHIQNNPPPKGKSAADELAELEKFYKNNILKDL
ncbi:hypothetical protein SD28_05420 [Allofrancisella guangzhouensis]|uniref:Uncharacterized protein n=2 Tax=Allofrancisella guangzhouensis TaxID=594679 RepID=A0A0A8E6C1_9GAMM|nr:hypothetical protein [Allofrancisella guangzhouensis]AJC49112.1 hypothetical protein SD28_05420 [Allofrancisella guangzhouensis]MBK2026826.1 hypothetical protein [Allofrancisella guangzhouensis]MBK2046323.1 hypothetical protein [Allofrancisella guangzhouensis]